VKHLERGCDGCAGGFVGGGDEEDSLSSSSSISTASPFSSFVVFGELFQIFPAKYLAFLKNLYHMYVCMYHQIT